MGKWKNMSMTEKVMILLIIMLIIGIISRWGYIKSELKDTRDHYFPSDTTAVKTNPLFK